MEKALVKQAANDEEDIVSISIIKFLSKGCCYSNSNTKYHNKSFTNSKAVNYRISKILSYQFNLI